LLAIRVTVDVTEPPCKFADDGEIEHVVFGGPPEQLRLTAPVKPPIGVSMIV
jgi:hypothetical protein